MEHLLLAPLGRSPGAVLGLLDWLNAPEDWVNDGREKPPLPRVTHLWVVTTSDKRHILDGSLKELKKELQTKQAANKQLFDGMHWRVFIAEYVQDIVSTRDAAKMAEILYRLVLQGEDWRKKPGTERRFSVSITGGRKTMSADLQRAATFLEVDAILQMVFAGEDKDQPYDIAGIRRNRKLHHPVITASGMSPWRSLLDKPWSDVYPGRPLVADNFGLHNWNWTHGEEVRTWPEENPESLDLTEGLKEIADKTKTFADQALASGVGPYFLQHDLRNLIDNLNRELPERFELGVLTKYLVGLAAVINKKPPNWSGVTVRLKELPALCDQALTLVFGRPVQREDERPEWVLSLDQGEFHLGWKGWVEHCNGEVHGITQQALLLVLRNFLANAWRHGKIDKKVEAWLTLEAVPEGLRLTSRNRLPPGRLDDPEFRVFVGDENGEMPRLLQPFRSVASKTDRELGQEAGDGLGLFTVVRTVARTREAVKLVMPKIDPWPLRNEDADFLVGLLFSNVTRRGGS